jgi:F-type H+-transporting ATPase subunit a
MKRFNIIQPKAFLKVIAIIAPLLLSVHGLAAASTEQPAAATQSSATATIGATQAAPAAVAMPEEEKAGDVIMHHILNNNVFAFPPFGKVELQKIVVAGYDISVTKHVVMLWLVSAAMLIVFSIVGSKYKNITARQAPKGVANTMEALIEFVRLDVAKSNIGPGYEKHLPYLITVFMFILFANLFGLIPYGATATGNINVTLTLAVFTFIITQIASLKSHGLVGFVKHLTAGTHWALWIIIVPIEIIGLFTKPFALTVRLFANMTAGHIIILSLIFISFILKSYIVAAAVSVPFAIFIYLLELFVAFLQAFIFTMLSALFIGLASAHEGHDEHSAEVAHH